MPDYNRVIQHSIDYIERNLYQEIQMEDIADNVGFSLYHFMRIFYTFTGYTLKSYVRERRLSEAAKDLIEGNYQVKQIAGKYSFISVESFIRAFKKQFRDTPLVYKKNNQLMNYTPKLVPQFCENQTKGRKMNYKIKEMSEINAVGLMRKVKHGDGSIHKLWMDFKEVLGRDFDYKNDSYISICPPHPQFMDKAPGPDDEFSYFVGMIKKANTPEIPQLESYSVKPATYAVFTHEGSPASLADTYRYISCEWIKSVDYEWAMGHELEIFDERFSEDHSETSKFDIYVPIIVK